MKQTTSCPICKTDITEHTCRLTLHVRMHLRECHPNDFKSFKIREDDINAQIKKMRADYPDVRLMLF
jgi:hypothetical protein